MIWRLLRRLPLERRRQHTNAGDVEHKACSRFISGVDDPRHAFPVVQNSVIPQKGDDDLVTAPKPWVQFAQGIQLFVAVTPGNLHGFARELNCAERDRR
jgi:hypothetical protein